MDNIQSLTQYSGSILGANIFLEDNIDVEIGTRELLIGNIDIEIDAIKVLIDDTDIDTVE